MGTLMQERVETAGLELTIEIPEAPVVYLADQRLMKQSIAAILSNAIKFNREHGQVAVLLRIGDNGEARLSVSDSGIGIPAERIESCFDAFGQVDSSLKRHYEGAGLGLTLAKAYVESHGGACQIESVVGEGTTVTLSLPAERRYIPKISIAG
jgi:signal transduction histidine kinase